MKAVVNAIGMIISNNPSILLASTVPLIALMNKKFEYTLGIPKLIYFNAAIEFVPLIKNSGTEEPPKKNTKNKYAQVNDVYVVSLTNEAMNNEIDIPSVIVVVIDNTKYPHCILAHSIMFFVLPNSPKASNAANRHIDNSNIPVV